MGERGGNQKQLCEEWQQTAHDDFGWTSLRHDAWSGDPTIPYSGCTVYGKVALDRPKDSKDWVERPVAVGKYALDHMEGKRYKWHRRPRDCLMQNEKEQADQELHAVVLAASLEKEAKKIAALAAASVF